MDLHDHGAEMAVLGTLLMYPKSTIPTAAGRITADTLDHPPHQALYQAIVDLYGSKGELPEASLRHILATRNADARIIDEVRPHADAPGRLEVILDQLVALEQRRRMVDALARCARHVYSPTVAASSLLDVVGRELAEAAGSEQANYYTMADAVPAWLDWFTSADSDDTRRHMTGLHDLDNVLGGLGPGELTLLAGRPGMGKSTVANAIKVNMGRTGVRVLTLDLEMRREQQLTRLAAMMAGVNSQRVAQHKQGKANLTHDELTAIARKMRALSQMPIAVRDDADATPATLDAMIAEQRMRGGVDVVIIDHAGLMSAGRRGASNYERAAIISRALKKSAKRHNVPVLALVQLNRAVEQRADKRPTLSDLRDSGTWEQDADVVVGLYYDEYYSKDSTMRPNILEALVLKNRNGPTGTVDLYVDMSTYSVRNLARQALEERYV